MIIQPTFDVPLELAEGIASGDLVRHGGVVRDTAGRLVAHLKEIPTPEKALEEVTKSVAHRVKSRWVAMGAGVLTLVVLGGGIVLASRNWKKDSEPAIPECVQIFNRSLRAYLDAIQNRRLDADIIDRLITDLDAVIVYGDEGDTAVAFSPDRLATLTKVILDYTSELAKANHIELDERGESGDSPADAMVIDLRRHLGTQRRILGKAA